MELRRQPHIPCYQRAWLRLLTDEPRVIACRFIELQHTCLRIVLDEPVPLNAPVCIESGDWMALGEVCHCAPEYQHYMALLQLDQMAIGLRVGIRGSAARHISEKSLA